MIGRTNAGGGGGGLNFKIVGGNTVPSNPKENTIWINTSTKITSYIFSATEPEALSEGMVWITNGTSSTVEFNALKKNGIQVYPIYAKQYVSSAWVDKTAKSYQGGAWVDWVRYLYNKGDECVDITGGWEGQAVRINSDGGWVTAPIVNKVGNEVTLTLPSQVWDSGQNNQYSGGYFTNNPIDVSSASTLKINVTTYPSSGYRGTTRFGATSSVVDNFTAVAETVIDKVGEYALDVSNLSESYYVFIHFSRPADGITVGFDEVHM